MSKNHENSALTVCHCDNVLIDVEFTTSSLLTNTFILGTDADFCSGIDPRRAYIFCYQKRGGHCVVTLIHRRQHVQQTEFMETERKARGRLITGGRQMSSARRRLLMTINIDSLKRRTQRLYEVHSHHQR